MHQVESPEFVSCKVSTARTWYVSFSHGWAQITLCPETGGVAVQSDWLDGQYTWPLRSLGEHNDLFSFITGRTDTGYLCEKFFGRPKHHVDLKASREKFKAAVLAKRRRRALTRNEALVAFSEACDWDGEDGPGSSLPEDVLEMDLDLSDFRVTYEDPHYVLMRTVIMPTLLRSMKENP
jgi:hypothetical protein